MTTQPPRLEILEISEMTEDRFRAVFKLQYDGDGYIELTTKACALCPDSIRYCAVQIPIASRIFKVM